MLFVSHEMIAPALAAALFPAFGAGHILLFRRKNSVATLPVASALYAVVWFAVYGLVMGPDALSFPECAAGLAAVAFFCLGYMQIFSLTCRGFSLRILVEIDRHRGLDTDGILREYSQGRGIDWLMDKRLDSMAAYHLVHREQDALTLARPHGLWMGTVALRVKRILGIEPGG